jgi:hypothetical protein
MTKELSDNARAILDCGTRFKAGSYYTNEEGAPCRDFKVDKEGRWLLVDGTSSGDYHGSLTDLANKKVFEEIHESGQGVWFFALSESHGSTYILIDLHAEIPDEAVDTCKLCAAFGILDDSIYAEIESEKIAGAWACERSIVVSELGRIAPFLEGFLCALPDETWDAMFREHFLECEKDEGWYFEGTNCILPTSKIVDEFADILGLRTLEAEVKEEMAPGAADLYEAHRDAFCLDVPHWAAVDGVTRYNWERVAKAVAE